MSKSMNRIIIIVLALIIAAALAFVVYTQFAGGGDNTVTNGEIDYSIQPVLGEAVAPVKVAMFEDFSCVHCATFTENVLPRLKDDFLSDGQVAFYFVNNQFLGPNSLMAGIAGECAYEQDEALFWDYKTVLMRAQNQVTYGAQGLSALASNVPGLDADALSTCIEERRYIDTVNEDLELGRSLGVTSTPTVLVNDRIVETNGRSDPSYDAIAAAITSALEASN